MTVSQRPWRCEVPAPKRPLPSVAASSAAASLVVAPSVVAPSVIVLLLWMIVPLAMTLWFSFQRYNLLMPGMEEFTGFENYSYFLTDPGF